MNLKFARFDSVLCLDDASISTLEVHDRALFTRLVASLISELGDRAVEPYFLFEGEKQVAPKGKMLILNNLPSLPLRDRALEKLLYQRIAADILEGADPIITRDEWEDFGRTITEKIRMQSLEMWGTYDFGVDWEVDTFLKAFAFGLDEDPSAAFLDNLIRFFGLCVDIGMKKPLVLVNVKSFLEENDLEELFSQAIFHGIPLLLMESWVDHRVFGCEKKMRIDQRLLEF